MFADSFDKELQLFLVFFCLINLKLIWSNVLSQTIVRLLKNLNKHSIWCDNILVDVNISYVSIAVDCKFNDIPHFIARNLRKSSWLRHKWHHKRSKSIRALSKFDLNGFPQVKFPSILSRKIFALLPSNLILRLSGPFRALLRRLWLLLIIHVRQAIAVPKKCVLILVWLIGEHLSALSWRQHTFHTFIPLNIFAYSEHIFNLLATKLYVRWKNHL